MSEYTLGYKLDFLEKTWAEQQERLIVTIPSKQRCERVPVLSLFEGWIPRDRLWVVVEAPERERYEAAHGDRATIRTLTDVNRGVSFARQGCMDQAMDAGARWLVMLDDDIDGLFARAGLQKGKFYRIARVDPPEAGRLLLAGMIRTAKAFNFTRTCLSVKTEAWRPKQWVRVFDWVTPFALFNLDIVRASGLRYGDLTIGDDVEMTLLMFERRLMWGTWFGGTFSCPPCGVGEGGIHALGDREELSRQTTASLCRRFPAVVRPDPASETCTGFTEPDVDAGAIRRLYGLTGQKMKSNGHGAVLPRKVRSDSSGT